MIIRSIQEPIKSMMNAEEPMTISLRRATTFAVAILATMLIVRTACAGSLKLTVPELNSYREDKLRENELLIKKGASPGEGGCSLYLQGTRIWKTCSFGRFIARDYAEIGQATSTKIYGLTDFLQDSKCTGILDGYYLTIERAGGKVTCGNCLDCDLPDSIIGLWKIFDQEVNGIDCGMDEKRFGAGMIAFEDSLKIEFLRSEISLAGSPKSKADSIWGEEARSSIRAIQMNPRARCKDHLP